MSQIGKFRYITKLMVAKFCDISSHKRTIILAHVLSNPHLELSDDSNDLNYNPTEFLSRISRKPSSSHHKRTLFLCAHREIHNFEF